MRLSSVRIQNYRGFNDQTVTLSRYTCFVGPNGAGKSTILRALALVFRDASDPSSDGTYLAEEDFHNRDTSRPVEITVTLTDLSEQAQADLSDYVRQGSLIVSVVAKWDDAEQRAQLRQFGQRLGFEAFRPFFEAAKAAKPAAELKQQYTDLQASFPELPSWSSKEKAADALKAYEAQRPEQCVQIPSEDQFYGFSRGINRLEKYIQWVLVPAVKDASTEEAEARNTALGKLLARSVRQAMSFDEGLQEIRNSAQTMYAGLLQSHQESLTGLSSRLDAKLKRWAHLDASVALQWANDPEKAVRVEEPWAEVLAGERQFQGKLARFGHGFQRSYLLALLQELASSDDAEGPTLVLACEEPELYQHPPQARHLSDVLSTLCSGNAQIMLSTHSPHFVSGTVFEDVRLVRYDRAQHTSTAACVTVEQVRDQVRSVTGETGHEKPRGSLAKLHQALQAQINEMFFASVLVLVEGIEDVAYITTYLHLSDGWDEFRRLGCHIVPTNGKSEMIQPLAVARRLAIPTFVVFDSDANQPDRDGSQAKHIKDNTAILRLCDCGDAVPLPPETFRGRGIAMWHSNIGGVVADDVGAETLRSASEAVRRDYGGVGGLEKNVVFIGDVLLRMWAEGHRSQVLTQLCQDIVGFAREEVGEA